MAGESGRRPANRREQIALTAAEMFCTRGYHNVGVDEIADAVGITGPALYRHFRNKQALLAGAMLNLSDSLASVVAEHGKADGPSDARLDAAFGALTELSLHRRTAARLYQWEGRHLAERDREEVAVRVDTVVRTLRDLLMYARPELTKFAAGVLVRSALSVVASPSTHRATLPKAKAQAILADCWRTVLSLDDLPPATPRAPQPDMTPDVLPRRERLLTEAVRLFHRHGYHAVSMEDIGAAAGINSSSVYRHFPSKGDLLAAAYHRATARLEVAASDALAGGGTAAEVLGELVHAYVRLTFAQADLAAVYLSENENLPGSDRHALRQAQRRHIDVWVRLAGENTEAETQAQLRFRVHAALNVVTDLARLEHPAIGPEHAERLVLAVLHV